MVKKSSAKGGSASGGKILNLPPKADPPLAEKSKIKYMADANQTTHQFDFLIEYILALFDENKINLTDDQKKIYIPQVLAQVELRLGLELLPKLNEKQKEKFTVLMNNKFTTPGEWRKFWYNSIPTFEEDVKEVLVKFAEKVKQILAVQA